MFRETNRKGGAALLIVAVLAAAAIGGAIFFVLNSRQALAPAAKLYTDPIAIGTVVWPGYLGLYVAQEKGYFKDAGLDVNIKQYSGLADLYKDYIAGKVQATTNLTLDALDERLEGLDHKIILAIDYSNGADAIMARAGINTVSDFKGKRIGYEPGTLEEFFIRWALQRGNLSLSEIVAVSSTAEESAARLASGTVDVAVTYEPFVTALANSEKFHPVYTSREAPGLIMDVLTIKSDFITQYPGTVQAIVKAYFRGIDYWRQNPDEADAIVAKAFGDTPANIKTQLEGITMLDQRDNLAAFTFGGGLESLYGNLRNLEDFVRGLGNASTAALDTDALIDPRFIRAMGN